METVLVASRDWVNRTITAYSIHGRHGDNLLDYATFFAALRTNRGQDAARHKIFGQVVTVTTAQELDGNILALRFIAGSESDLPIFFNSRTGREEVLERQDGIYAVGSWAIVDTATRMVALESKRPGVGSTLIERYLELEGRRRGLHDLRIDLNQESTEGFEKAVKGLAVVKRIAVTVSQPNLDWSDDHNTIHQYAEESGAGAATVELKAPRGESLGRGAGIFLDAVRLSRKRISSLKNVIVTGTFPNEPGDTSINLSKFQRRSTVRVPRRSTPAQDLATIEFPARSLLRSADND